MRISIKRLTTTALILQILQSTLCSCLAPEFSGSSKGSLHPLQSDSLPLRRIRDKNRQGDEKNRRSFVIGTMSALLSQTLFSQRVEAGEVGARITKAVTTSDLGISFRRAIVRGAQTMDRVDSDWEKFSDKYSLGAARSKAGSLPAPKVIPERQPLDTRTAQQIFDICDKTFCSVTGIASNTLSDRIQKIAKTVQVSFQRSGVEIDENNPLAFSSAAQYNFVMYAHFKAYSELIIDQNIPFPSFRTTFEARLGEEMLQLFLPEYKGQIDDDKISRKDKVRLAMHSLDSWCRKLQDKGLLAAYEVGTIDDDDLNDWIEGISDLEFNLSLDGDATMDSQILLQEQGYRLHPNFFLFSANYIMSQVDRQQKVSTMDYYFDTDYNSDPDKFEVKEVLVTVSMDNMQ